MIEEKRPGAKMEELQFAGAISGQDYSGCRLEWCRGKAAVFSNCKFHSALIRLCYFHRAKFIDCDFTGAIIIDSNLRGARFENCIFKYTQFRNTLVELDQVLINLPEWENCRRELLRNLRKNAESVGEIEDSRIAFKAEMESSLEHWRKAWKQPDQYSQSHHPGIKGRLLAMRQRTALTIQKYYWGYGESPMQLLLCSLIAICIFAFLLRPVGQPEEALSYPAKVFELAVGLVGGKTTLLNDRGRLFSLCFGLFRIGTIGLIATTIVRRFVRR